MTGLTGARKSSSYDKVQRQLGKSDKVEVIRNSVLSRGLSLSIIVNVSGLIKSGNDPEVGVCQWN